MTELSVDVPEYRYFTADILTGRVVMEVPFEGVSWERKVNSAGSFSGKIAVPGSSADFGSQRVTTEEDHFDLYETTMPGRHALYVMRDGVCVWGGIIWSREYDIIDKTLTVSGLEFVSYLFHRVYWKNLDYSNGITVRALLTGMVNEVLTDQPTSNDGLGYSASDTHRQIVSYARDTAGVVTITTYENHGYFEGLEVTVQGLPAGFTGQFFISEIASATVFKYETGTLSSPVASTPATGGVSPTGTQQTVERSAAVNMTVLVSPELDDYLILGTGDVSQFTFSGTSMSYVGEIIANFANNGVACVPVTDVFVIENIVSQRFDFTVDCAYDPATLGFTNTFKAWPVKKDLNDPTRGTEIALGLETLYGPSNLGAGALIFEHPGNIVNLQVTENADAAATRTWVIDNQNDLGANAAPYYSSYTNVNYLAAGWPILEVASSDRDYSVESDQELAPHSLEAGQRLSPPIGEYTVTVNGSLSPEVGSYLPGDWCVVIPGDVFIKNRLRPPYENREGVLVRKIVSFKVSVPDNPAFPEVVDLELRPEWEVTADE
jgi:hypothetical protein